MSGSSLPAGRRKRPSDTGVSESFASARPVIGLTTYLQRARSGVWDVPASFLPSIYIDGVTLAGGIAALLPPQPVDQGVAERVISRLDGLVVTGGADVDPGRYRRPRHAETDEPARDRDDWEFALLHAALDRRLPVLGICRGAQVLNVALGGTLHQHLPDRLGHERHRRGDAVFSTTAVRTVPGTRLAALVGESTDVQCYHHQAIADLGDGLIVSATDGMDGVVEAVELAPGSQSPGFCVAVQWHPEERLHDLRLFAGVVDAARNFATERAS